MKLGQINQLAAATAIVYEVFGPGLSVLPLIKILYLVDREMLGETGASLTGDEYVSMKNGPVLKGFYGLLRRKYVDQSLIDLWHDAFFVERLNNNKLGLIKPLGLIYTDCLAPYEIEKLKRFALEAKTVAEGNLSFSDWIHLQCPEWKKPTHDWQAIPFSRILKSVNPLLADDYEDIEIYNNEVALARERSGFVRQTLFAHAH